MVDYSMNNGNYSYSMNGRIFSNLPKLKRADVNELKKQYSIKEPEPEAQEIEAQDGVMQEYNSGTMIPSSTSTDGIIRSQKREMITDRNAATLEDLKKVMPETWLTKSFLNQYFDFIQKKQTTNLSEISSDLYRLKANLNVNGKEIKTIGELIDVLTSQIPNTTKIITSSELQNYLNKFDTF